MGLLLRRRHRRYEEKQTVKVEPAVSYGEPIDNVPEVPQIIVPSTKVEYPLDNGGGWYTLSDGSKVQGKDNAEEAELELQLEQEDNEEDTEDKE